MVFEKMIINSMIINSSELRAAGFKLKEGLKVLPPEYLRQLLVVAYLFLH